MTSDISHNGFFITLEGPDGVGKGTQLKFIKEYLRENNGGRGRIYTKEPGSSRNNVCEKIREITLNPKNDVDDEAEIFLYMADRCQHVQKVVLPALRNGDIVVCDRYVDSTYAYQGFGRRKGTPEALEKINYLNNVSTFGLVPDLTIIFHADAEIGLSRLGTEEFGEPDRLEMQGLDFHQRVVQGYRHLYENKGDRNIALINVQGKTPEEVREETIKSLNDFAYDKLLNKIEMEN